MNFDRGKGKKKKKRDQFPDPSDFDDTTFHHPPVCIQPKSNRDEQKKTAHTHTHRIKYVCVFI